MRWYWYGNGVIRIRGTAILDPPTPGLVLRSARAVNSHFDTSLVGGHPPLYLVPSSQDSRKSDFRYYRLNLRLDNAQAAQLSVSVSHQRHDSKGYLAVS